VVELGFRVVCVGGGGPPSVIEEVRNIGSTDGGWRCSGGATLAMDSRRSRRERLTEGEVETRTLKVEAGGDHVFNLTHDRS
jgi:hypothetical protein